MSSWQPNVGNGTNQMQRRPLALSPAYAPLMEQNMREMLSYAHSLAENIRYYDDGNQTIGSWQSFLSFFMDETGNMQPLSDIEKAIAQKQDFEPHLGLLIVFLHLFGQLQENLNTFTARHLEHYFGDVLGLSKRPAEPDRVHVIFELARNLSRELIPAGTLLDAGKDNTGGIVRQYRTTRDLVVNAGKVANLQSVFVDRTGGGSRIYTAPVANSADGLGAEFQEAGIPWAAFGEPQRDKPRDRPTMIDALLGFAIASPQLLLREGARTITLILFMEAPAGYSPQRQVGEAFEVSMSGEIGWVSPTTVVSRLLPPAATEPYYRLELVLTLPATSAAVVGYDDQVLQARFDTQQPLVRVLLRQERLAYDTLKPLVLKSVEIKTSVEGIKNLVLANDVSPLDPGKPFLPFGSQPNIGANFYIGSDEIFSKRLDNFKINIKWHNLPSLDINGFNGYYEQGYGINPQTSNSQFLADMSFVHLGSGFHSLVEDVGLFHPSDPTRDQQITIEGSSFASTVMPNQYVRRPGISVSANQASLALDGFVRLSLSAPNLPGFQAFGHPNYVKALTAAALAQPPASEPLPNPPYTPEIKSLSASYTSTHTCLMQDIGQYESVFQIGPFGWARVGGEGPEQHLLPQISAEGECRIGLAGLQPPATIDLLFQLAEDTARQATPSTTPLMLWHYRAKDRWMPLPSENLLADNTLGFQQSGIISLLVPGDASSFHTAMLKDRVWLKAEAISGVNQIKKVIGIYAQVALCILDIPDGAASLAFDRHLVAKIPANAIKGLATRRAGIKKTEQPYTSFYGRPSEEGENYHTRVAERLRHKNRAVAPWDYERLVLERFPVVFKVYCLSHLRDLDYQAPGAVTLIVVANLRNRNAVNPLRPLASSTQLTEISTYLLGFAASPFVSLLVENPIFEEVLLDFKVQFKPGVDPGFFIKQLNDSLVRFLSPWAFEEGQDIQFGGKIYKSDILAFVETRDYVDYVTGFKMFQVIPPNLPPMHGVGFMDVSGTFVVAGTPEMGVGDMILGDTFIIGMEREVAETSSPKSILVSAPSHYIREFGTGTSECEGFSGLGIGLLTVGVDFDLDQSSVFV